MIEEILPTVVQAVDTFTDALDLTLFPEEEAIIARAVDKRRREFTTARACARSALAGLGKSPVPILPGLRGAPIWPEGVVGSMTHCLGYRAAALAHADDMITIGVDAEPNEPLPEGVLDVVADATEQAWISRFSANFPEICWDRILFSAKESVYKAWFPLTSRWLDFSEATLTLDPDRGTFAARLLVPGPMVNGSPLTGFDGRWLAGRSLVMTTIAVLRSPS